MQLVLQRSTTTPYSDASRRSSGGWYQSVTTRLVSGCGLAASKKVAMSKLAILSMPVAVDERVGALDVPMQHALFMAVAEPDEDLRPEALDLRLPFNFSYALADLAKFTKFQQNCDAVRKPIDWLVAGYQRRYHESESPSRSKEQPAHVH
uniref:Uncharacterized protein n=1 Tax=Oryza rufipogon TaxID=4529 RepID=A0A0E0NP78_ORYRU